MSETHTRSEALIAATARRVALKDAVSNVERVTAAPSGMPTWRADLVHELDILKIALDQHVDEVEGEEGLLVELADAVPRLVNKIDRIRDEHPAMIRKAKETIEAVRNSEDVEETRSAVLGLLLDIVRHRQKGADLVYEGYSVDIGGG